MTVGTPTHTPAPNADTTARTILPLKMAEANYVISRDVMCTRSIHLATTNSIDVRLFCKRFRPFDAVLPRRFVATFAFLQENAIHALDICQTPPTQYLGCHMIVTRSYVRKLEFCNMIGAFTFQYAAILEILRKSPDPFPGIWERDYSAPRAEEVVHNQHS